MKGRWIGLGVALGFVLALSLGFAHAKAPAPSAPGSGAGMMGTGAAGEMWAAMDRMHDSSTMQEIHNQMPAELRERCDAMHEQMTTAGNPAEMGDMSGWMGGMMGSGSHAEHHAGRVGT